MSLNEHVGGSVGVKSGALGGGSWESGVLPGGEVLVTEEGGYGGCRQRLSSGRYPLGLCAQPTMYWVEGLLEFSQMLAERWSVAQGCHLAGHSIAVFPSGSGSLIKENSLFALFLGESEVMKPRAYYQRCSTGPEMQHLEGSRPLSVLACLSFAYPGHPLTTETS